MITSTSLFSSDEQQPVNQTGGASGALILGVLIVCCICFCCALWLMNDRKTDWVFTSGPNVGMMSGMMSLMCIIIIFLALTCKDTLKTEVDPYAAYNNWKTSQP